MKKRNIILIILVLFTQFIEAQQPVNWEQLVQSEDPLIGVKFIDSDGDLYGMMSKEGFVFHSTNEGESWDILVPDVRTSFESNNIEIVEYNGSIYFSSHYKIFEYNKVSNEFTRIIRLRSSTAISITEFAFLNNGNLVVAIKDNVLLYNSSYILLDTIQFGQEGYVREILPGLNTNFLYIKNITASPNLYSLVEFSSDFSHFGDPKAIASNHPIFLRNGVILGVSRYSLDKGETWIDHSVRIQKLASDPLGAIYGAYTGGNSPILYRSDDEGLSWNDIGTYLPDEDDAFSFGIFSANNGKLLSSTGGCRGKAYLYDNNLGMLKKLNTNSKLYITEKIEVGINENIFTYGHCGKRFTHYKLGESNPWVNINYHLNIFDTTRLAALDDMVSLPDGSWIANTIENEILLSRDKGQSWSAIDLEYPAYNIALKNGVIYLYYKKNNIKVSFSRDMGSTWETVWENRINNSYVEFAANHELYILPDDDSGLTYRNLSDNTSRLLLYQGEAIKKNLFRTSYTGSTLYVFRFSSNSFLKSTDKGITFEEIETPFSTRAFYKALIDHNNNIFLYGDDSVMFSSDEGETWTDISPDNMGVIKIHDLTVSFDNYVYIGTSGPGIIKYSLDRLIANDETELQSVSYYPNPVTSSIKFNFEQRINNAQWIISDVSGRKVLEGHFNSYELEVDLAQIKNGIYFMAFSGNNYRSVARFIKM